MTFPKEIIEFSIWSNLDKQKEIDLIILKGHLILEILVGVCIGKYLSEGEDIESLNLTFHKKIDFLKLLSKNEFKDIEKVIQYLKQINKIRNSLAHTLKFDEKKSGINKWANEVLDEFPVTKLSRFTYKSKIVHAFSALGNIIYKNSLIEDLEKIIADYTG